MEREIQPPPLKYKYEAPEIDQWVLFLIERVDRCINPQKLEIELTDVERAIKEIGVPNGICKPINTQRIRQAIEEKRTLDQTTT